MNKTTLFIEMKGLGNTRIFSTVEISFTANEEVVRGYYGYEKKTIIEFAGLESFDYVIENEHGDKLEEGKNCDESSNQNTYLMIEHYLISNWEDFLDEVFETLP
jgi:hypothetical protein